MKSILTVAAALAVSAAASATPVKVYNVSTTYIQGGELNPRAGFTGTGFEAAEGFAVGNIHGQNGWTTFGPGLPGGSVFNHPSKGRVLQLHKDPGLAGGGNRGAFSPMFKNPDAGTFMIDVKIDDNDGADYDVVGQSPSQGFLTFRVKFHFGGNIRILDNPGLGLAFVDTGVQWLQNQWANLTVNYDAAANTMNYHYNGAHIYTSVAGMFAGTNVEQAVLLHDNFQHFGTSFSGGPVAGYMDNLKLVPTPGAAALLGLAGLAAARRRRA